MRLFCRLLVLALSSVMATGAFASASLRLDSFEIYETNVVGDSAADLVFVPKERWVLIGVSNIVPLKVKDSESFVLENLGNGRYQIVSYNTANFSTTNIPKISSYTVLAGDFNGDGKGDLVLKPKTAYHDLLMVMGSTASKPSTLKQIYAVEGVDNFADVSIAVKDTNGDGKSELILTTAMGSTLTAHYTNGFNASRTTRTGALVGQTQFDYSVTQGGAASVTVPVTLPKGAAGHTPSVAVTYNSQMGNGLLGMGAGLNAFDTISRCKPRKPMSSTLKWTDDDQFCTAGQYLKQVDKKDIYISVIGYRGYTEQRLVGSERFFRTEVDNGILYIYESRNNGTSFWTAQHKDGTTSLFGDSSERNTKHMRSAGDVIQSWALSTVKNKFDVAFDYTYRKFGASEYELDKITYADVTVKFGYETRPDQRVAFDSGSKKDSSVRLSQIRVTKGADTFREYEFSYKTHEISGVSKLDYVQECVGSTACLPKLAFGWVASGVSSTVPLQNTKTISNLYTTSVAVADMNGNGVSDLVSLNGIDSKVRVLDPVKSVYSDSSIQINADNMRAADVAGKAYDLNYSLQVVNPESDLYSELVVIANRIQINYTTSRPIDSTNYVNGKKKVTKSYDCGTPPDSGTYSSKKSSPWSCTAETETVVNDYGVYSTVYTGKYYCTKPAVEKTCKSYSYTSHSSLTSPSTTASNSCPTASWYSPTYCGFSISSYNYGATEVHYSNTVQCKSNLEYFNNDSGQLSSAFLLKKDLFQNYHNGSTSGAFSRDNVFNSWCPSSRLASSTEYRGDITSYADINGDGKEIRFVQNANELRMYHSGTSTKIADAGEKDQFYFVDINQDGLTDVLHRNSTISVRLSKGNNSFESYTLGYNSTITFNEQDNLTFADINRDGLTDLIHTAGKAVRVRFADKNGKFSSNYVTLMTASTDYPEIYTAEFDGDGKLDLGIREKNASTMKVYSGVGNQLKLATLSDKLGEHVRFGYKAAIGTDVYTPTSKTLTADEQKYLGSGELVSQITVNDITSYYKYAGGFIHRPNATANAAKGFTGFESIVHVVDRPNTVSADAVTLATYSRYETDFPLSGKVKEVNKTIQRNTSAASLIANISFAADGTAEASGTTLTRSLLTRDGLPTGGADFGAPSKLVNQWRVLVQPGGVYHLYNAIQDVTEYEVDPAETAVKHTRTTVALNELITGYPRVASITTQVWADPSNLSATPDYTQIQSNTYRYNSATNRKFYEFYLVASVENTYNDSTLKDKTSNTYKLNASGKWVVDTTTVNPEAAGAKLTQFDYDAFGNVTKTTLKGKTSSTPVRYSETLIDDKGLFVTGTTDTFGTSSQLQQFDMYGNPQRTVDVNGLISTAGFDELGRPSLITDAHGVSQTTERFWCSDWTVCPSGAVYGVRVMGEAGGDAFEFFDDEGRTVLAATAAFNKSNLTNGSALEYQYVQTQYDQLGRVTRISTPKLAALGGWTNFALAELATSYKYDELNRVTKETRPNGLIITNEYAPTAKALDHAVTSRRSVQTQVIENGTVVERYTKYFDVLDNHIATQDQAGNWLWYQYDAKNRKTHTHYQKPDSVGNPTSGTYAIVTEYDEFDRVTKVTDPNAGVNQRTYNRYDQLETETNALNHVTRTFYDSLGQIKQVDDADGTTTCYNYDTTSGSVYSRKLNDITVIKTGSATCDTVSENFIYQQWFNYEPVYGQVLSKQVTAKDFNTSQVVTETYSYDQYRRLETKDVKVGATQAVVQTHYYDPITGTVYGLKAQRGSKTWEYEVLTVDQRGNVTTAQTKNDQNQLVYQQASYDAADGSLRYKALTTDAAGNAALDDYKTSWHYEFNDRGYLTGKWKGNKDATKATSTFVQSYAYTDALGNRLNSYTLNGEAEESYTYDYLGNIRQKTDNQGTATYNYKSTSPHQLATMVRNNTEVLNQQFDDAGNVVFDSANARDYARNENGKITAITEGLTVQNYRYFGHTLFASQSIASGKYDTRWYLSSALEIKKGTNEVLTINALPGVKLEVRSGVTVSEYVLTDHLGSVQAVYKQATIDDYEFSPFGLLNQGSDSSSDRIFTDHEYAQDLNIIHMQGRVYNPVSGQFLSADPIVKRAHNLQHYNRYSYVANNPMSYTDPTGFVYEGGTGASSGDWESGAAYMGSPNIPSSTGVSGPDINVITPYQFGLYTLYPEFTCAPPVPFPSTSEMMLAESQSYVDYGLERGVTGVITDHVLYFVGPELVVEYVVIKGTAYVLSGTKIAGYFSRANRFVPNNPNIVSGQGSYVRMDGHKIYDSNFPALSTNPSAQYRFSDPSYRSTAGDVYFGENIVTSYMEVRKNLDGKSLFVGDVRVDNILDLTDPNVLKQMNIDPAKLTARVDNPVQQKAVYGYTNQVSNQAYDAGYNGILYPSSRKTGNNQAITLFGGRYDPDAISQILDRQINP